MSKLKKILEAWSAIRLWQLVKLLQEGKLTAVTREFRKAVFILVWSLLVATFCQASFSYAHSGDVFSAWASVTPTIDGVLSSGEWDDASIQTFTTEAGANGVLYIKNDLDNLYLAIRITDSTLGGNDEVCLRFDNNNNGLGPEVGDDVIGWHDLNFRDGYSPGTGTWSKDTDDGGSSDGLAAATGDGTYNYFEISHPLDTTDNDHDFSLSSGNTVGFGIVIRIDGIPKGYWPSDDQGSWADIVVAPLLTTMDDNAYGNAALAYWQASPDELSTLIIIQNTNTTAGRYIQYRIRGECSTNQIYNGCIHLTPGDSIPLWIHISGGNLILTNNETGADIATLVTGVTDEMRGYLELTCWITACCTDLAGNDMAVRTVLMGTDWWVGINAAMVQDWADTGANTCVVDDEELPTFDTYWGRYWSDTTTHGRLITVFPGGFDASCQCSISGHGWDEGGNNVPYNKTLKDVAKTPIGPYEGISPSIDIPTDATAGAIEITGVTEPMFGFMLMEDPSGKADALPLFK